MLLVSAGTVAGVADADAYLSLVNRVGTIVENPELAETPVPGCPDWTVREVVAHLAGLAEDWIEGNLENYASDAWTQAQVLRFAGASIDEIVARWRRAADELVRLEDHPLMGPPSRFAFGDAVVHEADVRGALGLDGVPTEAVAHSLKGQIAMWRATLHRAHVPTLLLRTELRDWWLGTPEDAPRVEVEAPAYEVFRALAGRRSVDQIRAWNWSQDPEAYIAAGLPYPFSFAPASLER